MRTRIHRHSGPVIFLFYFKFIVIVAEELKAHWEKLERERRHNEALTSKLAEMESAAVRRETDISELKRLLQLVKEEHQQVMQVNNGSRSPYLVVIITIIVRKCGTGTK